MVVSETVGVVPRVSESEVQPWEITGGQSGKKRSAEEKLNNSGEQHHERQGAYTSNIVFVYYMPVYVMNLKLEYRIARKFGGLASISENKILVD